MALAINSSWRASAAAIGAGAVSHRRVDPTTSDSTNVTTPDGRSGAATERHHRTDQLSMISPTVPHTGRGTDRGLIRWQHYAVGERVGAKLGQSFAVADLADDGHVGRHAEEPGHEPAQVHLAPVAPTR